MQHGVTFIDRIGDEFRDLRNWAAHPLQMGAVSPTSRALARLMVEVSRPDPKACVLETGAGVVTEVGDEKKRIGYVEAMLDRVVPDGVMTQLFYAFSPPVPSAPGRFTVKPMRWVPFNFPPGRVWIYRRLRA
jgi:phospholipid N-methyltransferase